MNKSTEHPWTLFTGSVLLSNIVILHSSDTLENIYRFLHQLIGIMYISLQGCWDIRMAKSHLHILDICAALDEQGSVCVTQTVIIEGKLQFAVNDTRAVLKWIGRSVLTILGYTDHSDTRKLHLYTLLNRHNPEQIISLFIRLFLQNMNCVIWIKCKYLV